MPLENRNDTYRLGTASLEEMVEFLSQIQILPIEQSPDIPRLALSQEEATLKLAALDSNWDFDLTSAALGDDVVSMMERFRLSGGVCIDKLLIFQASLGWAIAKRQEPANEACFYNKRDVADWLGGVNSDKC